MARGSKFYIRRILYSILHFFVRLSFRVLFQLEIKGEEYVPRDESVVILANHTSYIDPVVMGVATPQELNYMAKKELFKNILFRWLITTFRAFPLRRGTIDRESMSRALNILAQKEPLLIFAQGTRSAEGEVLPTKPGVGMIIYKSKAKAVPAIIRGSSKILPRNAKFIHIHKLRVHFGRPFEIERFFQMPECKETYELIADEVTKGLIKLNEDSCC